MSEDEDDNDPQSVNAPGRPDPSAWWKLNGASVVEGRRGYRWPPKADPQVSLRRRNDLASECTEYARRHGTLSKELGAKIVGWGFNGATAAVDDLPAERFESTLAEAFRLSNEGHLEEAASVIVSLPRIGISTASKLLALPSGGKRVIYDHRTAKALTGLRIRGATVPVPPSRSEAGTTTNAKLLCRGYELYSEAVDLLLREASRDRVARQVLRNRDDIEMGLFMRGGER